MTTLDALHLLGEIGKAKRRITSFEKDYCRLIAKKCASNAIISKSEGKWLQDIYSRCYGGTQHQKRQYIA